MNLWNCIKFALEPWQQNYPVAVWGKRSFLHMTCCYPPVVSEPRLFLSRDLKRSQEISMAPVWFTDPSWLSWPQVTAWSPSGNWWPGAVAMSGAASESGPLLVWGLSEANLGYGYLGLRYFTYISMCFHMLPYVSFHLFRCISGSGFTLVTPENICSPPCSGFKILAPTSL